MWHIQSKCFYLCLHQQPCLEESWLFNCSILVKPTISTTPWGNSFKFAAKIQFDLRMSSLDYSGQRSGLLWPHKPICLPCEHKISGIPPGNPFKIWFTFSLGLLDEMIWFLVVESQVHCDLRFLWMWCIRNTRRTFNYIRLKPFLALWNYYQENLSKFCTNLPFDSRMIWLDLGDQRSRSQGPQKCMFLASWKHLKSSFGELSLNRH